MPQLVIGIYHENVMRSIRWFAKDTGFDVLYYDTSHSKTFPDDTTLQTAIAGREVALILLEANETTGADFDTDKFIQTHPLLFQNGPIPIIIFSAREDWQDELSKMFSRLGDADRQINLIKFLPRKDFAIPKKLQTCALRLGLNITANSTQIPSSESQSRDSSTAILTATPTPVARVTPAILSSDPPQELKPLVMSLPDYRDGSTRDIISTTIKTHLTTPIARKPLSPVAEGSDHSNTPGTPCEDQKPIPLTLASPLSSTTGAPKSQDTRSAELSPISEQKPEAASFSSAALPPNSTKYAVQPQSEQTSRCCLSIVFARISDCLCGPAGSKVMPESSIILPVDALRPAFSL